MKGPYVEAHDPLIELLRSTDTGIRAQAVKALSSHVRESKVEREILDILHNDDEPIAVRHQALLSLWSLFGRLDIRRDIINTAIRNSVPTELRITAYKTFSRVACYDAQVRAYLHSALVDENPAIVAAVAWALWTDTTNQITRQHLLALAKDRRSDPLIRIEVLRSLFQEIDDWEVQRVILELAEQTDLDARVRETALLALAPLSRDWPVRRTLRRIAGEGRPAISLAATKALGGPSLELSRYFEHIVQ